MRVIITRPAEDATSLAAALQARGHEPVIAPLSHIRYQSTERSPGQPAATIFTSKNAVRALEEVDWARRLIGLPAYCVGAATAQTARDAGFLHVVAGGGTGGRLAEHIAYTHAPEDGPLLYLTGEHLAFDIKEALEQRGFTVWRRTVYRNELVQSLALPLITGLHKDFFDAIMLLSPRTAEHFVRLVQQSGLREQAARLCFLCLSENVAEALAPLHAHHIEVAARPTQDALLELLEPPKSA